MRSTHLHIHTGQRLEEILETWQASCLTHTFFFHRRNTEVPEDSIDDCEVCRRVYQSGQSLLNIENTPFTQWCISEHHPYTQPKRQCSLVGPEWPCRFDILTVIIQVLDQSGHADLAF